MREGSTLALSCPQHPSKVGEVSLHTVELHQKVVTATVLPVLRCSISIGDRCWRIQSPPWGNVERLDRSSGNIFPVDSHINMGI